MSRIARAETARISFVTSCRLLLAVVAAASLAACAQAPVGRQKADLAGTSRHAAVERPHRVAALHPRPISRARAPDRDAKQTPRMASPAIRIRKPRAARSSTRTS